MYKQILVPLDGSELAAAAVPLATAIARATVARLRLVHVQGGRAAAKTPSSKFLDAAAEAASADLRESVETAIIEPQAPARSRSDTATHIAAYAAQHGYDLIVLSTRGESGLKRVFEGSVAEALLRVTPCPVLFCRPQPQKPLLRSGSHPIRKLVIALDQTDSSEDILQNAVVLAGALHAEVVLVHVLQPMRALATVTGLELASYSAQEWAELNTRADAYLAAVQQQLTAAGLSATVEKPVSNDAGAAIMETADRVQADMIALASRAPQGLVRSILGSVGDRLVRNASCPVLVIRAGA